MTIGHPPGLPYSIPGGSARQSPCGEGLDGAKRTCQIRFYETPSPAISSYGDSHVDPHH
jgi:hypothetical protein